MLNVKALATRRDGDEGFTLIELLIVVVIIGILAAIAIPKFASTKQKAYIAAMKSDLKNLITAEESYFADYTTYTTNLGTAYATTTGVTMTINAALPLGAAVLAFFLPDDRPDGR